VIEDRGEDRYGRARRVGEAPEAVARGQGTDEHARIRGARAHADAIAEQRATALPAGGVDCDDGQCVAARTQRADQGVEQRGLARAGRARDPDARCPREGRFALEAVEQRQCLLAAVGPPVVGEIEGLGDCVAVAGEQALREFRRQG
jgi:hypothetical protein